MRARCISRPRPGPNSTLDERAQTRWRGAAGQYLQALHRAKDEPDAAAALPDRGAFDLWTCAVVVAQRAHRRGRRGGAPGCGAEPSAVLHPLLLASTHA